MRKSFQRSAVLKELNQSLPPSGPLLKALARFDPFPRIAGPDPNVAPPNSAIARDPQVRAAGSSVVKVLGNACGLGVQGSGWIAGNGMVVTNAHVVAGQDDTTVQVGGEGTATTRTRSGSTRRTTSRSSECPGVSGVPALRINVNAPLRHLGGASSASPRTAATTSQPARLGRHQHRAQQGLLWQRAGHRRITAVRGIVRSGNSGGPVVDGGGRVVTTIFAATLRSGSGSGFGVPDTTRAGRAEARGARVDTGPCTR